MCVPKSEEELGCSFLLSPGKKAGQQERGAVGREALLPSIASTSLVQSCTVTLGNLYLLSAHISNFLTVRLAFHLTHRKANKIRAAQKESGHQNSQKHLTIVRGAD